MASFTGGLPRPLARAGRRIAPAAAPATQANPGGLTTTVLRALSSILVFSLLAGWQPGEAAAQERPAPEEYNMALAALEAGDTAAALDLLRAATRRDRDFGPAFLRLGVIVGARANLHDDPAVGTENWFRRQRPADPIAAGDALTRDRGEAAVALRRALELMGPEPELILEYGLYVVKKILLTDTVIGWSGPLKNADSLRRIETAITAAERRGDLAPERLAAMYYNMALVYETVWEVAQYQRLPVWFGEGAHVDDRGTRHGAPLWSPRDCLHFTPQAAARCAELPVVYPWVRDRASMMHYFRKAVDLVPANVEIASRLLGHLADEESWEEYHAVAHRLAAAAPRDPRPLLLRGLGLHHVGRSDRADSVFQLALALVPPEDLERRRDISTLITPSVRLDYAAMDYAGRRDLERIFFTINDPIYLTEVEERRMEHYSRVTWTDLKFDEPTSAWGSQTHRGRVWVKYGEPDVVIQELAIGTGFAGNHDLILMTSRRRTGNWLRIIFRYRLHGFAGRNRFSFPFVRAINNPTALHTSPDYVDFPYYASMEIELPQVYRPRTITSVTRFTHQMARFRGVEPHLSRLEVFGSPPLLPLGVKPGASVQAGLFLHDAQWYLAWQHKQHIPVGGSPVALSYRLEVPNGTYHYTLEARESGPDSVPRPLARTRLQLLATEYPGDRVSLSDILLADDIVPLSAEVRRRDDVRITGSRTQVFQSSDPVHVYFEVYGLAPDRDGMGRYRAELVVADTAGREPGLAEQIARGVQGLLRRGAEPERPTRMSWERTAPIDPADDRVPEFLKIELPPLREGSYYVQLNVTDLVRGDTAATSRLFIVRPPPPPGR